VSNGTKESEVFTAPIRILSMGWGVQTWALAAMIAVDEAPPVDFIVHADTGHELAATYEFARTWTPWLEDHGLPVVTVHGGRTEVVREDWSNSVLIPAFTVETDTGKRGQVRRQCTHDWKIMPLRAFARAELERRKVKRSPGVVEMALGISTDEFMRMRDSDVAYARNVYPLIDLGISRAGCVDWLERHELPQPPKSACTFCPYGSIANWKRLKRAGGPDWQEAVAVDESIRDRRPSHGKMYVHPNRRPLQEAIDIPEDHGAQQLTLTDACETGYCWV